MAVSEARAPESVGGPRTYATRCSWRRLATGPCSKTSRDGRAIVGAID